jgi:hypothetical protein
MLFDLHSPTTHKFDETELCFVAPMLTVFRTIYGIEPNYEFALPFRDDECVAIHELQDSSDWQAMDQWPEIISGACVSLEGARFDLRQTH